MGCGLCRDALSPALGALLAALAVVLVAGLVNIVYKAAGESITEIGRTMDPARLRRSRRAQNPVRHESSG